jgi:putative transposase
VKQFGWPISIGMARNKHLNSLLEQVHRFIKRRVKPMLDFKSFASAASTIARTEIANMIRKG